jgi:hypothetical protein
VEGGYSWNVEGGMWNEKCWETRKEEGVRSKEKCNAMYDDYDEE